LLVAHSTSLSHLQDTRPGVGRAEIQRHVEQYRADYEI